MSELQMTAHLRIHGGKLEGFKNVAAKCMDSTRKTDSGTLQYDWFFNSDQTECVVRETYRDSEAVLEHLANIGKTAESLLDVCDLTIEVFGSPTPELAKALGDLNPRVYSHYQSI